jgi:DNA-binding response OmpR family regulator
MPEKILVVDDDVDTLRSVGMMLQRQGYQIIAANNGHQALVMAQNERPDLVLLDVMMPDLDGYDVTRRLRSNPTTSGIPIIMFTAKTQVDDKVLGFEVGVDDYLTKVTAALPVAILAQERNSPPLQQAASSKSTVMQLCWCIKGIRVSTVALNLGISTIANARSNHSRIAQVRVVWLLTWVIYTQKASITYANAQQKRSLLV